MAGDTINVKPSGDATAVPVATDIVDEEHHPLYKMEYGSDGEATQVDSNNPLPTSDASGLTTLQTVAECLDVLIIETKLTNHYLAQIVGEDLRIDSELEDR